jgi:hypothetical protein
MEWTALRASEMLTIQRPGTSTKHVRKPAEDCTAIHNILTSGGNREPTRCALWAAEYGVKTAQNLMIAHKSETQVCGATPA